MRREGVRMDGIQPNTIMIESMKGKKHVRVELINHVDKRTELRRWGTRPAVLFIARHINKNTYRDGNRRKIKTPAII